MILECTSELCYRSYHNPEGSPTSRELSAATMSVSALIFTAFIAFNVKDGYASSTYPKLLVVSYDAFRYDYFNRNVTPFMNKLKNDSTQVDYMMNIFVTKTFPNHHTMATGLYAESHGVTDNELYDPVTGNVTKDFYKLYHYNNNTLPIWTINEKSNKDRHSGGMMWPGSFFEYGGVSPTFALEYHESVPWKDRVDTIISWFTDSVNPINFGVLYIEEPDYHGHVIGIHSAEFNEILTKLDNITKYLHEQLAEHNLQDVNVIHLSDHGMTTVTLDRIINLTNYINDTDYTFVGTSPGLHIYPKPGKEELIYQKLKAAANETKHFRVFKREEIPGRFHYKNNPRIGPIFVIAEVGYAFQNLLETIEIYKKKLNITVDSKSEFGLHGYDNEEPSMHPMFFATGPAFLPKCKLEPFRNTDLVPLFCKILELDCPPVNGTAVPFYKCLRSTSDSSETTNRTILGISMAVVISAIVLAAVVTYYRKKRRASRYNEWKSYYEVDE